MNDTILLENRAYWTQRAPSYSEVNREELSTDRREAWKQVLVERIAARFPNREPDDIHVLEVGTGPGFFAILLAEAGYRVTAIDLTPSMLEEARRNAGMLADRIDFVEMNAEALGFPSESFDVILSRNVTWNLPEPQTAYGEWIRVLKPGGLYILSDTGIGGVGGWIDNHILFRVARSGDCHTTNRHGIARMMEKAGFTVTESRQIQGMIYSVTGKKGAK